MPGRVQFLVNTQRRTLTAEFIDAVRPSGYLVAPAYLTGPIRGVLASLPARYRRSLLVDNGLFDDLAAIRTARRAEADELTARLARVGIIATQRPRRADVPDDLRVRLDALVDLIESDARGASGSTVDFQLSVNPQAVVGAERIVAALWYSLGLETDLIAGGGRRFARLLAQVIDETVARRDSLAAARRPVLDLPVVPTTDYDTAVTAGRMLAERGIDSFSLPCGAFMADDRFTSSYAGPQGVRTLQWPVPQRLLRPVLVARGIMDGWSRVAPGTAPRRVHMLGLGQPLVLALVVLALTKHDEPADPQTRTVVTADATSPLKDAPLGIMYTSQPVFRRLRAPAVALNLLRTASTWDCPCAWCRGAELQLDRARDWFASAHVRSVDDLPLRAGGALAPLLPLFALDNSAAVTTARVGHNHWVIEQCMRGLRRAMGRAGGLERQVRRWVSDYPFFERQPGFARGLVESFGIATADRR